MGISERKEREKVKRRKTIISAAEKIFFAEKGESGTMDDVAEMVELSKGTLYLYFRNKDHLLYGIAGKGVEILARYLKKAEDPALTGKEQLSDLGDEFVHFVEDYPRHFELILRFELAPPVNPGEDAVPLLMEPALGVLRKVLEKGQQDGSLRKDLTANELVITLWSQMIGILQSVLHKERYIRSFDVSHERIIKGHFRMIMKGISPG
ncbi:MAG: TetR/AcrR family transcriptional regulator [Bacteroidota bacterium]